MMMMMMMMEDNSAGEQRSKFIPSLHGLNVKPLSSRRLLPGKGTACAAPSPLGIETVSYTHLTLPTTPYV